MLKFPKKNSIEFSRPLFAILLTTIMLAALLATNTVHNLNREQEIMEGFLLDEGLTLIRSFEAGARITMMHEMTGDRLPIQTLVEETAKAGRIAFISVSTEDGVIVAGAGDHDLSSDRELSSEVFRTRKTVTRVLEQKDSEPIFEVATIFQTLPSERRSMMMGMMGGRYWQNRSSQTDMLEKGRAVIHLGLRTQEFITAREQDFRHTLFMGTILFLLGSAGFYFLFLYQGMRVTRTTLANMKLYTGNIIESMPDGLITLDSDGRIVSCNPRALEFAAMTSKELKGRRPEDLFEGWPTGSLKKMGRISSFSYTFVHEDSSEIPVEISGSPLLDDQGRTLGAVLLLRDLREIRAMEKQLVRSRRLAALGRMAAGIAHEIRNPLGTLRGFAQYFGSRADDDASREYSALMVGEVDRLNESISSLLQFSRPRDPDFSSVDPEELFEKTRKLLEHDFEEKDISLSLQEKCPGQLLEADSDLLLQVLLNLLKNALNACRAGDTVTLSCATDEKNIYMTVADTGIGMNREDREQMFDPFFTTRKAGTGLGLAVSHQIVEQHHGSFEVRSRPGRGTTVVMQLPRRQQNTQ